MRFWERSEYRYLSSVGARARCRTRLIHRPRALEDESVGGPLRQHAPGEPRHVESLCLAGRPPPRNLLWIMQPRYCRLLRQFERAEHAIADLVLKREGGAQRRPLCRRWQKEHAAGPGAVLGHGNYFQENSELFSQLSALRAQEERKKWRSHEILTDHAHCNLPEEEPVDADQSCAEGITKLYAISFQSGCKSKEKDLCFNDGNS